ncbi:hypothetical protein, partial [Pseudomonas fragi]
REFRGFGLLLQSDTE